MDFKVRNIEFSYNSEGEIQHVNVRFDYFSQVNETNFSGLINVSTAEYEKNSTNISELSEIVKTKFKEKVASL